MECRLSARCTQILSQPFLIKGSSMKIKWNNSGHLSSGFTFLIELTTTTLLANSKMTWIVGIIAFDFLIHIFHWIHVLRNGTQCKHKWIFISWISIMMSFWALKHTPLLYILNIKLQQFILNNILFAFSSDFYLKVLMGQSKKMGQIRTNQDKCCPF